MYLFYFVKRIYLRLIIHKVDDFIFSIFPDVVRGDLESLKAALTDYYTLQSYKPKVTFDNGFVNIEIDIPAIITQENDFRKVVSLCEKGKYDAAKPMLNKLIELNPTNSEYHRIMGQILSEQGDQDEAINCLIDALRWNSNNGWALLMMGNIFSRYKKDVKTAMKYYDQALIVNPDDYISINNIGATLMREEKYEEAKKYFLLANRINGKYPNTHFSLGFIAKKEMDYHGAFKSFIESIKNNTKQDALYNNAMEFAFLISKDLLAVEKAGKYYLPYRSKLEHEGDCTIEIVEDNSITTPALIEFAENYNREMHIVRHKTDYPLVEHLIMHELVHLDLVIQARKRTKTEFSYPTKAINENLCKTTTVPLQNFRNWE